MIALMSLLIIVGISVFITKLAALLLIHTGRKDFDACFF